MKFVAQFPRTAAIAATLIMVLPIFPMAVADPATELVPRAPELGHVKPGDQCVQLGNAQTEALAAANALAAGNTAYFAYDRNVPALCGTNNAPIQQWKDAIRQLDAILDNYRNVSLLIQKQADERVRYTYPEGPCQPGDNLTRPPTAGDTSTPPYNSSNPRADRGELCGVLRPSFTLINDRFDGRRLGGFGEWTVVTERGEEPAWQLTPVQTYNGTEYRYRFGNGTGYPEGSHQWLVSPEIDMNAVRGDAYAQSQIQVAYDQAVVAVRSVCNPGNSQVPAFKELTGLTCSEGSGLAATTQETTGARLGGELLVHAYEDALNGWTKGLPVAHTNAFVDITFRMNFPLGVDGVRPWIYFGGDDVNPPTRVQLYSPDALNSTSDPRCYPLGTPVSTTAVTGVDGANCLSVPVAGARVLQDVGFLTPAKAFQDPDSVVFPGASNAWASDQPGFETVRVDLNDFTGRRVWILFEARSMPDTGRGLDKFGDPATFPRQGDYGFELASLFGLADGYPRDLRLKDVGGTYSNIPVQNIWFDNATQTRTTTPPGNDPLVVRIQNAGEYVENATIEIDIREQLFKGADPAGNSFPYAPTIRQPIYNVRPSETREIAIPWPTPLHEGSRYTIDARLVLPTNQQLPPVTNATNYTEPNVTQVRPPNTEPHPTTINAASSGLGGNVTAKATIRAYTDHDLTAVRASRGTGGVVEVCSAISSSGCAPLYAAKKGERRIIYTGVRNDGNSVETATAVMHLTLGDVDKSNAILDGAVRSLNDLLPGETRPVSWSIAPGDPGIYKATIHFLLADGSAAGSPVSRLVFVQRSTGLICFDDLADNRECSPSFEGTVPPTLRDLNFTAAALADDGTLFATSQITDTTGGLYARTTDGNWQLVEDLSSNTLTERVGGIRQGVSFADVQGIAIGPEGSIYLVGGNGTAIQRAPTGTLTRITFNESIRPNLTALAGNDADRAVKVRAGAPAALSGGAIGGTPGYTFAWRFDGPSFDAVIEDASKPFTNVTNLSDADHNLRLVLNVTDSAGATTETATVLHVLPRVPSCHGGAGVISSDNASESALLGSASDVLCVAASAALVEATAQKEATTTATNRMSVTLYLNGTETPYIPETETRESVYYQIVLGASPNTATYTVTYTPQTDPSDPGVSVRSTAASGTVNTALSAQVTRDGERITVSGLRVDTLQPVDATGPTTINVKVTVGYDPNMAVVLDTIPDGTFVTGADVSPPAPPTNVRAAPAYDNSTAIILQWRPVSDAVSYQVRRQNTPDSAWAIVHESAASKYRDTGLVPGNAYAYSVQAFDAAGNPSARSVVTYVTPRAPLPDYSDAAWWGNTLVASSNGGRVWTMNMTTKVFESHQFRTLTDAAYDSDVNDLLVSNNRIFAAGDAGSVFANEGFGWNQTIANASSNDLNALVEHAGTVYAVGDNRTAVRLAKFPYFEPLAKPICNAPRCDFVAALNTQTDQLFLLDESRKFYSCEVCAGDRPGWTMPDIPVPSIVVNGKPVRPALTVAVGGASGAFLLGQGGVVLDFGERSVYANSGDWTTTMSLAAHDGAVFETVPGNQFAGAIRFVPPAGAPTTGWKKLRIHLNHSIPVVPLHAQATVRLFFLPYPTIKNTATDSTNQFNPDRNTCAAPTANTNPLDTCNSKLIMRTIVFTQPTDTAGWSEFVTDIPPGAVIESPSTGVEVPEFAGIEFYKNTTPASAIVWAIDDFSVEAVDSNGVSRVLVSWSGDATKDVGQRQEQPNVLASTAAAWEFNSEPFGLDSVSPWHISTALPDRPAWVFNSEFVPERADGRIGGSAPHIVSGWESRLVTPVIDLTEAFDPVVSFRHAYAFRTQVLPKTTNLLVTDGGWVEVQYLKTASECKSADPTATCWSKFYKLFPIRTTPDGAPEYSYPRLVDTRLPTNLLLSGAQAKTPMNEAVGPRVEGLKATGISDSYWGRNILANERGVYVDAWDTSKYELVNIPLNGQPNVLGPDGKPMSLVGRQIRVGFHAYTTGPLNFTAENILNARESRVGEGWYVTDFKVKGAQDLGVDLTSSNMTLRVGYDAERIGIGPGTRIPINVTVKNHGIFNALGLTGELSIRRVTDAASRLSEPVATIPLSQQPELPAGASVNYTFFWDVPAVENAKYVFAFKATPIGIETDEDPTDNVAQMGSYAKPILAVTHREFHTEFLVTPENATTDITRYVPIFINNTGNVPLADFEVHRSIILLQGQIQTPSEPMKTWHTQRVVPAGTRVTLQSISDEVNPATDLFWKAPARSNYLFQVYAETSAVGASTAERRIAAFATYLFDDVDVGPRGESTYGMWEFGPGWGENQPGFRSQRAYAFGDPSIPRYEDNADSSANLPTVDLSSARSARLGLYMRYAFPDAYDAAVIEASADGGASWYRLTPRNVSDDNGALHRGYGVTPIAASSPLHLTGDPRNETFAFTGSSTDAVGNVDGWVYREFDLTEFANITESNLPYVLYDMLALNRYSGTGVKDDLTAPTHPTAGRNVYFDSSWHTGAIDQFQYWETQNLTEGTVRPIVGNSLWWSSSSTVVDDSKRPLHNQFLRIPYAAAFFEVLRDASGNIVLDAEGSPVVVDENGALVYAYNENGAPIRNETGAHRRLDQDGNLEGRPEFGLARVPAAKIDSNDNIVVDWWEWADRYGGVLEATTPEAVPGENSLANSTKTIVAFNAIAPKPIVLHYNITQPTIVERKGNWVHLASDVSDWSPLRGENVRDLTLVYAPVDKEATDEEAYNESSSGRYIPAFADDRGVAISGFQIRAYKVANGQQVDSRVLMTSSEAWNVSRPEICVGGFDKWYTDEAADSVPCTVDKPHNKPEAERRMAPATRLLNTSAGTTISYATTHTATGGSETTLADAGVNFILSDVRPGDRVMVTSGPATGRIATIMSVSANELTFAADAFKNAGRAARAFGEGSVYAIAAFEGYQGTGWGLVNELPAIPAPWSVVPVRLGSGPVNYDATNLLPTGEKPVAWYTGSMCERSFDKVAGSESWFLDSMTYDSITDSVDFTTKGVRVGDFVTIFITGKMTMSVVRGIIGKNTLVIDRVAELAPAGTKYQLDHPNTDCTRPGEETRLVSPAIDLAKVAGDDAQLLIDHRYAFDMQQPAWTSPEVPLASGGVVEIQAFDSQTQTWSAWEQLYQDTSPKAMSTLRSDIATTPLGPNSGARGGYSAFTANMSRGGAGGYVELGAPFEAVRPDGATEDIQFLYSGSSAVVNNNPQDGWVKAKFDLKEYLGKTVRIGFHVYESGYQRANQNSSAQIASPESKVGMTPGTGWWITNLSVVGKVLHGAPVDLRLRAATDGNVHDGDWVVDDMGVFGSRYGRNVAIFVNQTPGAYGGLQNTTVTIPITLSNLGDTVRRDLAVEVRQINPTATLTFSADPGVAAIIDGTKSITLTGFNLAPGQSVVVNLHAKLPETLGGDRVATNLFLALKEYSAADDSYNDVPDNEVQGFLRRQISVIGERTPFVALGALTTGTANAVAGTPLDVILSPTNQGYGSANITLECKAQMYAGHALLNHREEPYETDHGETIPCTIASNNVSLPRQSATQVVFTTTPPRDGLLKLVVSGHVNTKDGAVKLASANVTATIGRSPLVIFDGMDPDPRPAGVSSDQARTGEKMVLNWTAKALDGQYGGQGPKFVHPTGHEEQGALLLGIEDSVFRGGSNGFTSYSNTADGCGDTGRCVAVSPPIDLHAYGSEHLLLSFWHMDRFANYDGGQVTAQWLVDETRPNEVGSWSKPCILVPVGGYEGTIVQETASASQPPSGTTDWNGYNPAPPAGQRGSPFPAGVNMFFTNPGRQHEQTWTRATIDLADQAATNCTLIGKTIRVIFTAYTGQPWIHPTNPRGLGQGWFIDDVLITPVAMSVAPPTQKQTLLDNTTKEFNIVVQNTGSYPDVIQFALDAGNSSTPAGSVTVPAPIALAPGERAVAKALVTLPRDPSFLPTNFVARLVASSQLDKHVYVPSDLVLSFAPRQWAELSLHADAPRLVVQEGTETFIPITVENNGVIDSVASQVVIVDSWPGGSQTYALDLPSMPSYFQKAEEATRVLEFRWRPVAGSVGMHTLTITADPLELGEEYTRVNNVNVLNIPVSELLIPDLDIAATGAVKLKNAVGAIVTGQKDADVTRYEITAGELATLEVVVKNLGKAGATDVDVQAFIGGLTLPKKTVPYIPPNSEVTLGFNWLAQKGEYEVEVLARTNKVEASNTNNRNPTHGVTLLIVKGYEVKTTMAQLTGIVTPPTEIVVPFNITNSGNAGEELRLETQAPPGWTVALPRDGLFLRAGETYSATARVHVPAEAVAGEQLISILAVARENPMKVASANTPVHVLATYGGSVVAEPLAGTLPVMEIPITLSNEGNSLEPWQLVVRLPAGWTSREVMPTRVVVPPHGETTFVLHVTAPETTAPGVRQLLAKATLPDGTRREAVVSLDVQPLHSALVTLAQDKPREAQGALAYPITVENVGNVEKPFKMLLLGLPAGINATVEPSKFSLAPGSETIATLYVTPSPGVDAGSYKFTGYTLFEGVSPDSPEGRSNLQQLQVTLVRPDIRVSPLEYAPRTDVRAGEKVVVKVSVANRGQGSLTDVPVHLFVDNKFVGETRIPTIAPNEKRDATINWTAIPGQHTLTAVVDPYKDSVDMDRDDNAVSSSVDVKGASVTGIAGGSKVPAPGFGLFLFAAFLAVVALRKARRPPR